jgi:hypothetical protein
VSCHLPPSCLRGSPAVPPSWWDRPALSAAERVSNLSAVGRAPSTVGQDQLAAQRLERQGHCLLPVAPHSVHIHPSRPPPSASYAARGHPPSYTSATASSREPNTSPYDVRRPQRVEAACDAGRSTRGSRRCRPVKAVSWEGCQLLPYGLTLQHAHHLLAPLSKCPLQER